MVGYKIKKGKTLPDNKFLNVEEIFFDGNFILVKSKKFTINEFRNIIYDYYQTLPIHKNQQLVISMCKALDMFLKYENQ